MVSLPHRESTPPHTSKKFFKPMEDRATGFQNFYLPPLKKKKQDKIFLFYVSGFSFFQIATCLYLSKIACLRAGTMSICFFFYLWSPAKNSISRVCQNEWVDERIYKWMCEWNCVFLVSYAWKPPAGLSFSKCWRWAHLICVPSLNSCTSMDNSSAPCQ